MKVGVQLPEVERRVSWAEIADMARVAAEGGLDSLWVGEHLLYATDDGPRGPWDAFSIMAALAAVTERVEIGPFVAATSFHHPALLAKRAATLDEISGGRFVLGLGAGWNRTEFDAFGFPYDHRVARFEEAFTIIRTLLREGSIDFHGSYHDLSNCVLDPPGPTAGGPPLMIGTTGERMLAITLPHVQLWNAWYAAYGNDPAQVAPLLERIDDACRTAGRDPASVGKTLALLWHFEANPVARRADHSILGRDAMVESLAALDAAGVHTAQLVLDPITVGTVEQAAETVDVWRRSGHTGA